LRWDKKSKLFFPSIENQQNPEMVREEQWTWNQDELSSQSLHPKDLVSSSENEANNAYLFRSTIKIKLKNTFKNIYVYTHTHTHTHTLSQEEMQMYLDLSKTTNRKLNFTKTHTHKRSLDVVTHFT